MQEFTQSFGFIIFFLVGLLFFTMFFGDKVAFVFLLLVLMGMVYTNLDVFQQLMGRFSRA